MGRMTKDKKYEAQGEGLKRREESLFGFAKLMNSHASLF